MTDRPILFSAPMVRALLAGIKTQTRRIIKPQPTFIESSGRWSWPIPPAKRHGCDCVVTASREWHEYLLPQQRPWHAAGDRLWVRETYTATQYDKAVYRADARDQTGHRWSSIAVGDPMNEVKWKPSIFMPRRYSRLTLYVTDVRVQRLQDISEEDARAEGVECDTDGWRDYQMPGTQCCADPVSSYRTLWDAINGPGAWEANPWVSVTTFAVRAGNIDSLPATLEEAA